MASPSKTKRCYACNTNKSLSQFRNDDSDCFDCEGKDQPSTQRRSPPKMTVLKTTPLPVPSSPKSITVLPSSSKPPFLASDINAPLSEKKDVPPPSEKKPPITQDQSTNTDDLPSDTTLIKINQLQEDVEHLSTQMLQVIQALAHIPHLVDEVSQLSSTTEDSLRKLNKSFQLKLGEHLSTPARQPPKVHPPPTPLLSQGHRT
jgi:hypothetical protein